MKFYTEESAHVLEALSSSENGLASAEAASRLERNGKNRLAEAKKVPLWKRFLMELADPMTIILLVAAAISAITVIYSNLSGHGGESFADVIIIMAVVIINAVLGVFQESKAEKAIDALQKMAAATSKVLRDGHVVIVKSEDLTVGDVVLLEAGDAVPADGRILESASMKIEEAALTGESVPADKYAHALAIAEGQKDVPLGDRQNMVYMGSTVVYGRGKVVITAVGMDTEMGKIADAIAQTQAGETPLQKKLGQLSKILTYLVVGISAFIFVFGMLRDLITNGSLEFAGVMDTFMVAVSLAVAAIPEGLATVVTIVLSIGVTKMAKQNAIIRRLTAVETLGCAQIICSDKTGTLTQNKMTVVETSAVDEKRLSIAMALCCDATVGEEGTAVGEPTECALVNYALKLELPKDRLEAETPRVGEAPFDSMRKMMSTVHKTENGFCQYTKGAPDEVLKRCVSYLGENGEILPLTDEKRAEFLQNNKNMADRALRVLCGAFRMHDALPADCSPEALENELVYLGLSGMIDPVRPEVVDAIAKCHTAGIRAVMITGDHIDTAVAIAKQLGIITDASEAMTGAALDDLSDEELATAIDRYGVYARVQPEHKVRIVKAWKARGCITAMTGDGVNDAPSIKSADIGVGMGITGTDVTKNVADMVLADDNFATIVGAVGEGRRIYDNVRKAIQFLLASNMSEVVGIFMATLFGFTLLKPVHLLWINLITDCFPALALGMEEEEPDLMRRKPRRPDEGVFAGGLGKDVVYQGLLVAILTLTAYFIGHFIESGFTDFRVTGFAGGFSPDGMTMAFLTMSMAEIFHAFNMRSQRNSMFSLKKQNIFLWGAGALSLLLTTAVIYIPFLRAAFEFTHISLLEYFVALGIAFLVVPIVELVKLCERIYTKKKAKE